MNTNLELPDYRIRQLQEALDSYVLPLETSKYTLKQHFFGRPDQEYYVFTNSENDNVLVYCVEDYIGGYESVIYCFTNELNAELVSLHKVKDARVRVLYDDHRIFNSEGVQTTTDDDWPNDIKMSTYATNFNPMFTGFMATIKPHNKTQFWRNLS